ncbi:Hpt domain-containing protein [Nonomuraea salmonea]|uniref:Hpt domain-containing protein n=1 Tax=Nonomuraea salmonea TaxID=46181 RepID=UPI0031F18C0E
MKGACATVGATREAELCRRAEEISRAGGVVGEALLEELETLLSQAPDWMDTVRST